MRKAAFYICENKDADHLRGNREADQRLCFRYIDSTIPLCLNPKFQASIHILSLYSLVRIEPGRKPERLFCHVAAHLLRPIATNSNSCLLDFLINVHGKQLMSCRDGQLS